jgi:hypothetical protein
MPLHHVDCSRNDARVICPRRSTPLLLVLVAAVVGSLATPLRAVEPVEPNCGYKPHTEAGELFNLTKNPTQKDNRYETEPEKVKELSALTESFVSEDRSTPGHGPLRLEARSHYRALGY